MQTILATHHAVVARIWLKIEHIHHIDSRGLRSTAAAKCRLHSKADGGASPLTAFAALEAAAIVVSLTTGIL